MQHHPQAQDGPEAFLGFVHCLRADVPQLQRDIKRVVAEGDLVVTHSHLILTPGEPGRALADFFRIQDSRVVEHWDVIQDRPAESAKSNGMF